MILQSDDVPKGRNILRLQFDVIEPRNLVEIPTVAVPDVGEEQTLEAQSRLDEQRNIAEVEAARAEAREEARGELGDELKLHLAAERKVIARTCEQFRKEREGYFSAVEAEVVKLALAIAARVLHREVKLDPMLLQGVVRVALGKVAEESGLSLRVPIQDEDAWRKLMSTEEAVKVKVQGDSRLIGGECVLETSVGRVELGLGAQLEEIEKGFFDLLQQRPA